MATAKERAKVAITSFEQLKPEEVTVYIDMGDDDKEYVITLRAMSFARWESLAEGIPYPKPVIIGVDANKQPITDADSPEFRARVSAWNQEIALNRLIDVLPEEMAIPGETREEKRAYLRQLDRNFLQQLINAMVTIALGGRMRLEQASRSFPGDATPPGAR